MHTQLKNLTTYFKIKLKKDEDVKDKCMQRK